MLNNTKVEAILFKTISLLKDLDVNYWLTDGTLLGIIREERILPWDLELDFGLWKSEVPVKRLINVFKKNGFEYTEFLPDMHCLVFLVDDIYIDLNLYTKDSSKVSIKWATYPDNRIHKAIIRIINLFFESKKLNNYDGDFTFKSFLKKLINSFGLLLPNGAKEKMYSYAREKYKYIGSSYQKELLEFKAIGFRGNEGIGPIDSEEYLRVTYGNDWKIPNKDYVWEEDTFNLELFDDRANIK